MAIEILGKFKKGDRVVVIEEESWCKGCHGTVGGVFPIMKRPPVYLIKLDKSPNPMIKSSWIYEAGLEKEEEPNG